MLSADTLSSLLTDLQRLDRQVRGASGGWRSQGEAILGAFVRHAGYAGGAVWLRANGGTALRLAASTAGLRNAPDEIRVPIPSQILDRLLEPDCLQQVPGLAGLDPPPHTIVPLRHHREQMGVLALLREGDDPPTPGAIELLRIASSYLTVLLSAQQMASEVKEGDFQLKYRLWELESLYDIGLSITSTLDLEALADEVLVRTISLLNARRAAVYLRKGDSFELRRSFGDVRGQFLSDEIDPESLARLIEKREPIRLGSGADCLFPGCTTLLALPITGSNDLIGVLAVADREQRDGGVGSFDDNDVRLVRQFATQAGIALENARLHREALEKQAMERELQLAATIQRDILPRSLPAIPGVAIDVLARPARQLGGDYYTFIEREDGFSLCVADVSGKSIPAAILVSALHAAIQLLFDEGRDLGEIATELNRHIHKWSSETKFATLVLATVDLESSLIRFVNAGHNPAYILAPDGTLEEMKSHGLPIGLMGESRYSTQTRRLVPGSLLAFYSDGITEADNEAGDEFGNERLEQILLRDPAAGVADLRSAIEAGLEAFVGNAPQRDDQTLVLVRVTAP